MTRSHVAGPRYHHLPPPVAPIVLVFSPVCRHHWPPIAMPICFNATLPLSPAPSSSSCRAPSLWEEREAVRCDQRQGMHIKQATDNMRSNLEDLDERAGKKPTPSTIPKWNHDTCTKQRPPQADHVSAPERMRATDKVGQTHACESRSAHRMHSANPVCANSQVCTRVGTQEKVGSQSDCATTSSLKGRPAEQTTTLPHRIPWAT